MIIIMAIMIRGSEAARQRGSAAARQRGSEAARQRGSEAARQRGSEAARQQASGQLSDQLARRSVRSMSRHPSGSTAPLPTGQHHGSYPQPHRACRKNVFGHRTSAWSNGARANLSRTLSNGWGTLWCLKRVACPCFYVRIRVPWTSFAARTFQEHANRCRVGMRENNQVHLVQVSVVGQKQPKCKTNHNFVVLHKGSLYSLARTAMLLPLSVFLRLSSLHAEVWAFTSWTS